MDSSVEDEASMFSMIVRSLSNWVQARRQAQGSERGSAVFCLYCHCGRGPPPLARHYLGCRPTLSALQGMWHGGVARRLSVKL